MHEQIFSLQNGSDIRGVCTEGYNDEKVNLTPEIAYKIGAAFALFLKEEKKIDSPLICIGNDSRISAKELGGAVIDGLCSQNATVKYFGLCTTPAMYCATKPNMMNADGSIMLTASHLPYNRNGMKFFTKDGGLDKQDINKLLTLSTGLSTGKHVDNFVETVDFLSDYAQSLVDYVRQKTLCSCPFEGVKIVVDAGNGAGGFFVDKVLTTLGADTEGSVFLDPDGYFPNHIPNPENADVMADFSEIVRKTKADLGVIFDTDVDRAALVDENASPVARNKLIALMSEIVLESYPQTYIVTDSVTSTELTSYIERRSGVHHRFKRGYNNIIKEAKKLNAENKECHIAIETSGHCAIKENDFLDDGAFLIVEVLIKYYFMKQKGQKITDILSDYHDPAESEELRFTILEDDFKPYAEKLLEDFKAFISDKKGYSVVSPNYEGIRINADKENGNGWALMRMSLHDPVIPINIESDEVGGVKLIKDMLLTFIGKYNLKLK